MATENLYEIREARDRRIDEEKGIRAEGYTGKTRYTVTYDGRCMTVWAAEPWQAMLTAAKSWGLDARKPAFHQEAMAWKI